MPLSSRRRSGGLETRPSFCSRLPRRKRRRQVYTPAPRLPLRVCPCYARLAPPALLAPRRCGARPCSAHHVFHRLLQAALASLASAVLQQHSALAAMLALERQHQPSTDRAPPLCLHRGRAWCNTWGCGAVPAGSRACVRVYVCMCALCQRRGCAPRPARASAASTTDVRHGRATRRTTPKPGFCRADYIAGRQAQVGHRFRGAPTTAMASALRDHPRNHLRGVHACSHENT